MPLSQIDGQKRRPLSHSQNRLLRRCPLSLKRYRDRTPDPATAPRDVGTAFHAVAEEAEGAVAPGSEMTEEQLLAVLTRKAALLEDEAADDLRELTARAFARGFFPGFPSDAQDRGFELKLAVDHAGKPCAYDAPDALLRGIVDRFYRENGGTLAVVDDWKTGRVIEAPGDQTRLYAFLVLAHHPDVDEVVARLRYVRHGSVKSETYTRDDVATVLDELLAIEADVARRTDENDWKPRVGQHCASCGYRANCPAFASEVVPLQVIATADEAQEAARQLVVLKAQAKDLDDALRSWVRTHGELDLSDETLGYRPTTKREVLDARKAAAFLRQHASDDAVWAALGLSVTELDRLLREATKKAPRGERKAAQESLFLELVEAGAVEVKAGSEFKRWRKDAEGEEAA